MTISSPKKDVAHTFADIYFASRSWRETFPDFWNCSFAPLSIQISSGRSRFDFQIEITFLVFLLLRFGFSFVKTTLTFCLQLAPLLGQEETDKLDNKLRSLNVTGDNIASLPFTLIL